MPTTTHSIVSLWRSKGTWLLLALLALLAVTASVTRADSSTIPVISLASEPLYARGFRVKPTLSLALSVEFPTVGAAYVSSNVSSTDDASYVEATTYVGYYDAAGCYTYDATNRYFTRTRAATVHSCGGTGFSGNFMNWSTSSAIDILRYALTGGDRVEALDTASLTVLQRAVLPSNFYNSSNFPSKQITAAQAANAVPSTLLNGYTGTVYIANCKAQINFGKSKTGSCDNAGDNGVLGISANSVIQPLSAPRTPASNYTLCAAENGTCIVTGPTTVIYGADYIGNNAANGVAGYKSGVFTSSVACTNAVFGDPISGTVKSCYISSVPPAQGTALTNDSYFAARVKVCDSDDAAVRTDFCQLYPNNNFKPTGNLQRYSDRVRVAVFGYLLDNTLARNGGVLRSPMKYVGPKTFDSSFNLVSGTNPVQEWDTSTGVFIVNPNADTMGVSGVINYTNHFGRTGLQGGYKTYDPVGELYYEAVRYLQGLQPTASAVSGITNAMKDGFPVYDTWLSTAVPDPVPAVAGLADYSCVKNNILTVGDINTHGDRFIPGSASHNNANYGDSPARPARVDYNEPDFYTWTKVVGAFESNHAFSYTDGQGNAQTTSNPMTVNTALWGLEDMVPGDSNGFYMAGISYWANTHDVRAPGLSNYSPGETAGVLPYVKSRPGMRVTSYFIDVNEYGADSLLANRKNTSFFLAAKYGGFTDASSTGSPFKDGSQNSTNADWESPTSPGDPKTYFLGSNGTGMITALNSVFADVAKQAGSIAGAAVSTTQVTTSAGVYQAKFDPSDWSGDVIDYPVTFDPTTQEISVGDDAHRTWSAATQLDSKTPANRRIVIGLAAPSATAGAGALFDWNAPNFEAATRTALKTPPYLPTSTPLDSDTTGQLRLAFLRGDRSQEAPSGLLFRKRGHVLGDMINSAAVYSGDPAAGIVDASYSTFYSTNKGRTPMLYVGANDGMLHGFNADTGDEVMAYIPSFVVPKLAALTSASYVHTSYVDSTAAVSEAQVGSAWKTVLVSGAGAGGQGVFALDVTTPTTFAASNVMWEFKDTDDADLGNVVGRPQIVKLLTSGGSTTPTYKWFAVVAGGVNNYAVDGRASTTGAPTLFFLDLAKPAGTAWSLGTNYYKVSFPVGDATKPNAVLGFNGTAGVNGEMDRLYIGDLQGNLWKLQFARTAIGSWSLATLSPFLSGSTPVPLFIATDTAVAASAKRLPITVEPVLVGGPNKSVIISFGTGKFLEQNDVATHTTQSIFAVYDNGSAALGSTTDPGRGYLQTATATLASSTVTATPFVWGRPASATDTTVRAGWVFNLPESTTVGERQVSGMSYLDGKLLFGSIEPPVNGCADGGGNQYIVDIAGAGGTVTTSTSVQGQTILIKVVTVAGNDSSGAGVRTTRGFTLSPGPNGLVKNPAPDPTATPVYRRSWRQISNYQDIHAP